MEKAAKETAKVMCQIEAEHKKAQKEQEKARKDIDKQCK